MTELEDRLAGVLLGTALGDALGLPCEGLSSQTVARRFGSLDRFRLVGRTGFVSDDTEQAALVAQSLARFPDDPDRATRAFRRSLLGWFLRLPFGIGLATLRASLRILRGAARSGVPSAGNGAAMRAAVIGVLFRDSAEDRRRFGTAFARVTHTDPRAVEGALYVAELAALGPEAPLGTLHEVARRVVAHPALGSALDRAARLAADGAPIDVAARELGTSGFSLHSIPLAAFAFQRRGDDPLEAIRDAIRAGGDADTNAAIAGALAGARHGASRLPADLIGRIHDGPFGPTHLRGLAAALARAEPPPPYSAAAALARNLCLYPVILAHGFRRLVPV